MNSIIFLTKVLGSLLCTLIVFSSVLLLRTEKQLVGKVPKLVSTAISILCILELCYSAVFSFGFFIPWEVRDDATMYQMIIFVIVTSIFLYIFNKNEKSNIMIILTIIWCALMTFYVVFLFNHFFLLVQSTEKAAFMNIIISLLCVLVALFSGYTLIVYRDFNDDLKTRWKENFVYVICAGIIFCGLSLSYALFVVWDEVFSTNLLLVLTLLSLAFTIALWILCYLKKSYKMIVISIVWGILMCCYIIYLFTIAFIL